MRADNIEFLEANRHHYTTLVNAGFIQHLDQSTRQRMLDIIHEEFNPGYIATLWCQSCIADMLKYLYVQYDKWVASQPVEEPVQERDHVRMTFPIQEAAEETNDVIPEEVKPAAELPKVDGTLFGQNKEEVKQVSIQVGKPTKDPVLPKKYKQIR